MRSTDAWQCEDALAEKSPVSCHIGDPYLQQVVETACDHVPFLHGAHVDDVLAKFIEGDRAGPIERNLYKCAKSHTELLWIELRHVALDVPAPAGVFGANGADEDL
jgi:hypothetical protein